MLCLKNSVQKHELDARDQYIKLLNRCDAVVVRFVDDLDAENRVQKVAVIEDVGLLFLEAESDTVKSNASLDLDTKATLC